MGVSFFVGTIKLSSVSQSLVMVMVSAWTWFYYEFHFNLEEVEEVTK